MKHDWHYLFKRKLKKYLGLAPLSVDLSAVTQLVCPEIPGGSEHGFSAVRSALAELVDGGTLNLPLVPHI